ncbi:MAG: hypothetical protein MJ169_04090 [Treponema sp.]|nr:hypothetical protein [Treponema sp.]
MKKTMIKRIFTGLFIAFTASVNAFGGQNISPEEVMAGIAKNRYLRGEFTYTSSFKKDDNGSGLVTISHSHGIIFFNKQPKEMSLVMTDKMLKVVDNGRQNVTDFTKNKMAHGFAQMTQAVYAGDYEALSKVFTFSDVEILSEGQNYQIWSMEILPSEASIKKAIKSIHLEGSYNPNTGRTVITKYRVNFVIGKGYYIHSYKNLRTAKELTDEEKELFK